MQKRMSVLKAVAFAVIVTLSVSTLAVVVVEVRGNSELRRQITRLEESIPLLSQRTESQVAGLSQDLRDASRGMEREMASARRVSSRDVTRMGHRLSGRLDDLSHRLEDLARPPAAAVEPEARAPATAAPAATAPATTVPAAAQPPRTTASGIQPPIPESPAADQDLPDLRRLQEGMSMFESGQYAQAREAFRSLLARRPTDSAVRLYYAVSCFRTNPGDATGYAQIERHLRSVLSSDPENPLALETLALAEAEQKRWAAALDLIERLLALQPDRPGLLKTAGLCALMEGDPARAHDLFDRATQKAPADSDAWSFLGDCEARLGNPIDAESAWKSALSRLDLDAPAGKRAGVELCTKLAISAYQRSSYQDVLTCTRDGQRLGDSAVLRSYEELARKGLTVGEH